ncbi:NADH-quinone oxidoreductase subunit M, partial [bacterium]
LALTTTMLGTFVALDLVLFYTFFELSLIPVAILILQRGGTERRAAAVRYFASLFAGSILMLVGMVVLSRLHADVAGRASFSLLDLQAQAASGNLWRGAVALQPWVFWSFALAFLVKSPALPFHSWLPGTYEEAPLGPLVASVVLKVGTYGLFRFCLPLFPEAVQNQLPLLTIVGTAGILYGAAIAITQRGIGRLLAFSTVSHVGFILIGLFSLTHAGLMGAAFQQTNHGLTAGALLVMVALLQRRKATMDLDAFGALKRMMPIYAALFFVVLLGNVGLPGTSGFVGEFLTMLGAFEAGLARSYGLSLPAAVLAGGGTVLAAGYLLYMFQRMFTGPATERANLKDLVPSETLLAGAFAAVI